MKILGSARDASGGLVPAAEALAITAPRLKELDLIDRIVNEPVGGAHRDPATMARQLHRALADALRELSGLDVDELLRRRHARIAAYGRYTEVR